MWEQLTKKGYEITNKRILGNPAYTSEQTRHKDLVQELALVQDWLLTNFGIWIAVDWMTRIKPYNSGFYCHLRGTLKALNQDNFIVINNTLEPGYEVFNSPTEAKIAAIEYTINNLI